MKKNVIGMIIALVLTVAVALPLAYFVPETAEPAEPQAQKLRIADLELPERIQNVDFMGLFVYNSTDGKYYAYDDPKAEFDKTKPVYVYTHGMCGSDSRHVVSFLEDFANDDVKEDSAKYWTDAGYNVLVFRWAPFASDALPMAIQKKIWSVTDSQVKMRYYFEEENGEDKVYNDYNKYSVAEMFGTYLSDYLTMKDFDGELRISGHSMGAQLALATGSYMNSAVKKGIIDKRHLPSRITIFDPYTSNQIENEMKVSWLDNRVVGRSGTISLMAEEAAKLKSEGIAVEYMLTGLANFGETTMGPDKDGAKRLKDSVNLLKYNNQYILDYYNGEVLNSTYISCIHMSGEGIYAAMMSYDLIADHTTGGYGFGPKTPTSYSIARMGAKYVMEENVTPLPSDDVQSSDVDYTKVAGFAFLDANANGVNDESMANRLKDVEVSLYAGDKLVATVTTNEGGYYEFTVAESYVGKNLTLKVTPVKDLKETKAVNIAENKDYYLMTNDIKNLQCTFTLKSLELKIVNLGFVKG